MKPAFNGERIRLPWKNWQDVEISPAGIHTHRGTFSPNDIDLLLWKAALAFNRGERDYCEDLLLKKLEERLARR